MPPKETQPQLPGLDLDSVKQQDADNHFSQLRAKFPRPETKELAEWFFRRLEKDKTCDYSVDALIKYRSDHDSLRVVLKNKDSNQSDEKWEKKVELPLDDREQYDELFVDTACEAYDHWLRVEQKKYLPSA